MRCSQAGAFSGGYFRPIKSRVTGKSYKDQHTEFPSEWFKNVDVAKKVPLWGGRGGMDDSAQQLRRAATRPCPAGHLLQAHGLEKQVWRDVRLGQGLLGAKGVRPGRSEGAPATRLRLRLRLPLLPRLLSATRAALCSQQVHSVVMPAFAP